MRVMVGNWRGGPTRSTLAGGVDETWATRRHGRSAPAGAHQGGQGEPPRAPGHWKGVPPARDDQTAAFTGWSCVSGRHRAGTSHATGRCGPRVRLPLRHRVGPWSPVIPVKVRPDQAGGDTVGPKVPMRLENPTGVSNQSVELLLIGRRDALGSITAGVLFVGGVVARRQGALGRPWE